MEYAAVPQSRWAYFTDPALNIGSSKSRLEVFESNGTTGEAIFEHPHFLKYLQYFIHGPDLPHETIVSFCAILNKEILTSGMLLDRLRSFARSETRKRGLDKHHASEEFYKLALECELDDHLVRTVRNAVRQVR